MWTSSGWSKSDWGVFKQNKAQHTACVLPCSWVIGLAPTELYSWNDWESKKKRLSRTSPFTAQGFLPHQHQALHCCRRSQDDAQLGPLCSFCFAPTAPADFEGLFIPPVNLSGKELTAHGPCIKTVSTSTTMAWPDTASSYIQEQPSFRYWKAAIKSLSICI